jgi:hypothetical protein
VIAPKTGEKLRFVHELLEAKKRKTVLPAAA